jgi:hypothetical protein
VRRQWWKPWKVRLLPSHLEPRQFPVAVVLGPKRFHRDDPDSVSMKSVFACLKVSAGREMRLVREEGLTEKQADFVAVKLLGKTPFEVWPEEWRSMVFADALVDDWLDAERERTRRFVASYLRRAAA